MPCDDETLNSLQGPCGEGWDDPSAGWQGLTCHRQRGRVKSLTVVGKAISGNIGDLADLHGLEQLELRDCPRVGGDVANLTGMAQLVNLRLNGTAVYSTAGVGGVPPLCPAVRSTCSRCDKYRTGNVSCVSGSFVDVQVDGAEPDTSCDGPGVGNDDCACCAGSHSARAASAAQGSIDWAGRPQSALGNALHHGACIDRTCADRDVDGLDDDTCPDAPSTEPSYENRRLRLIRCAGAEDCEAVCPMCWVDELERELSERSIRLSKPSGGARAALAPALLAAALLWLVCV